MFIEQIFLLNENENETLRAVFYVTSKPNKKEKEKDVVDLQVISYELYEHRL